MTKKRKAELCDAVILKFTGNKSFFWKDLHGNDYLFNDLVLDSDCDTDTTAYTKYIVLEPIINLLLEDGVLKRMDNESDKPYLSLTDKGNAINPDIKNRGYLTKYIKERNENRKKNGLAAISVATFIILCFKICNGSFDNPKTHKIDPTKTRLKKEIIEGKKMPDTTTDLKIISKDTLPKQAQLKNK